MLQFIKGANLSDYTSLLAKTTAYNDAFFLDTTNTRLYYDGKPLDVRITVLENLDNHYTKTKSYQFTNVNGGTTVIADAVIPDITDKSITLKNADYSNGLMSVKDKFLLDSIASVLGISINYTYYANVNHIKDHDNKDYTTMTDVDVSLADDGKWYYNFDSYTYPVYTENADGTYTQKGTATMPAGKQEVDSSVVRINTMSVVRKPRDIHYWSGGDRDDNQQMLTRHGGIAKGTKVSDLEKKTVSEILGEILFEEAKPVKISDNTAYIKFGDDTVYGKKYIEVGTPYPSYSDFETVFIPETWRWQSVDDETVYGPDQPLTEYVSTTYYLHDYQHPVHGGHKATDPNDDIYDVTSVGYADHKTNYAIEAGDKCVYYGLVTYKAIANAKDSNDSETYVDDSSNILYYSDATDGSILSANVLTFSGDASVADGSIIASYEVICGWKIYSNATRTSTTSLWADRNTEPGDYVSGYNSTDVFAIDGETLYFQWPSATTDEQLFYIYLPKNYSISSIGGANDMIENNWDAIITATNDGSLNIANSNNINGVYTKYVISKASGITTVKVEISQNESSTGTGD